MDIIFDNFSFTYALGGRPALSGICLTIKQGEIYTLCGASGSGKSTLLRCLKKAVTPAGAVRGAIDGLPDDSNVAIVFQNPETQSVAAAVLNDLAFQMENRGVDASAMKRRMSETAGFFGLEALLHKRVQTLSGGQKQLVALCAAMMCEPDLLLLDEPVSQLDPLAAAALLETVRKINAELGVTVIMAEHRLDDCAAISDNIVFLESGRLLRAGPAQDTLAFLFENGRSAYVPQLPYISLHIDGNAVLTPRAFTERYAPPAKPAVQNTAAEGENRAAEKRPAKKLTARRETAFVISDAAARYEKNTQPVLNRLSLTCERGECLCLLGGNGSGKTTLLKLIAGIIRPFMGRVRVNGRVGYLPQYVRDYFLHDRVADEIECTDGFMESVIHKLNLGHILDCHPFDVSGGEQQKAALAALLSRRPDIILLDEPTKGMEPPLKRVMAEILRESGAAVVIATHDMEYAARYADRCAMLFDGEIAYSRAPREFFAGNKYYTTAAHKACGRFDGNVILPADALALWEIPERGAD